jgi:hypothetical protein
MCVHRAMLIEPTDGSIPRGPAGVLFPLASGFAAGTRRIARDTRRRDDWVSNAVGDGEGGRRRMPKSKSRKKKSPKRVLALPDLEQARRPC